MKGVVERIIFQNPDNGWAVVRVRFRDGEHTVAGNLGGVQVGSIIEGEFETFVHPKYGHQLKPVRVRISHDASPEAIATWLSENVKGVGRKKADMVMSRVGDDLKKLSDVDFLKTIPGISYSLANAIASFWKSHEGEAQAIGKLIDFGLTNAYAVRSVKFYGESAPLIVEQNPYALVNVPGIGFKMADAVAKNLGITGDDPRRVRAAARHALELAANKHGHTAPDIEHVLSHAADLGVSRDRLRVGLEELAKKKEVVSTADWSHVGLTKYHEAEADILKRVRAKPADPNASVLHSVYKALKGVLTEEQLQVLKLLEGNPVVIMTGGPGTGKSYALSKIVSALEGQMRVVVAAPTGKAAIRLVSAGLNASTIHRAFGFRHGIWDYNEKVPLEADLLVLDEASMIDAELMGRVFRSIVPTARILLVGDANQLPSVGPGHVLGDLIELGAPTVRLTKIFRQAEDSPIISAAYDVAGGNLPRSIKINDPDVDAIVNLASKYWLDGYEVQVISPKYQGPLGILTLNHLIKERVNGPNSGRRLMLSLAGQKGARLLGGEAHIGDPIVCNVNSYDLGIMNGEVGVIRHIDDDGMIVSIEGRGEEVEVEPIYYRNFSLAYAISVHRAQGSEWANVIFVLGRDAYIMSNRAIIYTAMTRAKENLHIFADKQIMAIGVKRSATERSTWLRLMA